MLRSFALSLLTLSLACAAELPTKAEVEALIADGQAWLTAQAQPTGALVPGKRYTLGITQLALEALATKPAGLAATDPLIVKALAFQQTYVQADGGVYEPDSPPNYTTALALKAWAATGTGAPADIARAQNFIFGLQNKDAKDVAIGGIGYGSKGPGNEDLSNTSFAIEALRSSGVPAADPHLQSALKFLERCQNLSSVNQLPWVTNDGGAVYAPDESKAGGSWNPDAGTPQEQSRLASYGSMTYALISSYLTLDVKKDDPRVVAAIAWAKQNYQFARNPGMPEGVDKNGKAIHKQGLYYYFAAMAKSFALLDATKLDLPDGRTADWRADLFAAVKSSAIRSDTGKGVFWVNAEADRWGEGVPHLTTSYMIKALKRIHATL